MTEITVDKLWEYFTENKSSLANSYHLVASDKLQGVEIYLAEEKGFPFFSVEVDGEEVCASGTESRMEAETVYKNLLAVYISAEWDDIGGDGACRDMEISNAVEDLLRVLLEADPREDAGLTDEDMRDVALLVENYLFEQIGISVYHPAVAG